MCVCRVPYILSHIRTLLRPCSLNGSIHSHKHPKHIYHSYEQSPTSLSFLQHTKVHSFLFFLNHHLDSRTGSSFDCGLEFIWSHTPLDFYYFDFPPKPGKNIKPHHLLYLHLSFFIYLCTFHPSLSL